MSVQAMAWAMDQEQVTAPTARHVLLVLANYAGEDGRGAFPSVATIMRQTGLTRRTVQNNLAALQEAGAIVPGNPLIAAAWIGRADLRPNVWDLAMSRGAADAPRGVNGAHLTAERGAGDAPDPPLTFISLEGVPACLTADLWAQWATYRMKRDRRGWTKDAARLSLRTLCKLIDQGQDPTAVIEQSIEHGWTGLFPVKQNEGSRRNETTGRTYPNRSAADRVATANRHLDELERTR